MVLSVIRPVYLAFYHVLKRTFTMKYPYVVLQLPDSYRGKPRLLIEKCIGCGLCAWICSGMSQALQMTVVSDRNLPKFDLGRCCVCGLCAYICPTEAMVMTKQYELSACNKDSLKYPPEKLSQPPPADDREKVAIRIENGRGLSHAKV